jgi:hypothetical protein
MMVTKLSHPPVVYSLEDLVDLPCALGHKSLTYAHKHRWSTLPAARQARPYCPSVFHDKIPMSQRHCAFAVRIFLRNRLDKSQITRQPRKEAESQTWFWHTKSRDERLQLFLNYLESEIVSKVIGYKRKN